MKLSEYHTQKGDRVEWWNPGGRYDLVYKSRVFTDTYSKDEIIVNNADEVIRGGTGYGPGGGNLPDEVEHIMPDYFLYPRFLGTAYGFLSRGCPRNCGFCIVSGKEGRKSVKGAYPSESLRIPRVIYLYRSPTPLYPLPPAPPAVHFFHLVFPPDHPRRELHVRPALPLL